MDTIDIAMLGLAVVMVAFSAIMIDATNLASKQCGEAARRVGGIASVKCQILFYDSCYNEDKITRAYGVKMMLNPFKRSFADYFPELDEELKRRQKKAPTEAEAF